MTVFAVVIALFGALAAGLGAFLVAQEHLRRRRGLQTTGVVVDNVHGADSILAGQSIETAPSAPILDTGAVKITPKPRSMGYPVVEFATASGEVVRFRSSHGSRPPAHKVGDSVALYYDAADPKGAELAGEGTFLALVLLGLGIVFVAVAAALWAFAG
jgi:hypothetical protein